MSYNNRTYDTTISRLVVWQTSVPDTVGASYPGPGVFGVTTSGYAVAYSPDVDVRVFIFDQNETSPTGNVYADWATLISALALLPEGAQPRIQFIRASFTIPSTGMPVGGWAMRSATLLGLPVAGGVTITVPDGVQLDNLRGIDNYIFLDVAPGAGSPNGALLFSDLGVGGAWAFDIGVGAALQNSGSVAAIQTPGDLLTNTSVTLNLTMCSQNSASSTAALISVTENDIVTLNQEFCGNNGKPSNDWLTGTAGTTMFNIIGPGSGAFTNAGFLGGTASVNGYSAFLLPYAATTAADWNNNSPTTVGAALDRLAAAVGPVL